MGWIRILDHLISFTTAKDLRSRFYLSFPTMASAPSFLRSFLRRFLLSGVSLAAAAAEQRHFAIMRG